MNTADRFDTQISAENPHIALLAPFKEEASRVYTAAQVVIPHLLAGAHRFGRTWIMLNAKPATSDSPHATRLAATVEDGLELVLHFPLATGPQWARASTGRVCVVLYQLLAMPVTERSGIFTDCMQVVVHNLARRRPRVPVRPSEAMVIGRDEIA